MASSPPPGCCHLPLNGSDIYLPPFVLLLACAARAAPGPAVARWLTMASALFVVSLTCRAVDRTIVRRVAPGHHLGWHLVNAAMLYCCIAGLLAAPHYRPFG